MMQGTLFDIQTYSIHDGPGIRTCVFFKGCPLRCAWCHNPESQSRKRELAYRRDRCEGCGACVAACPRGALRLERGRVVRDADRCIACGQCADACPNGARELIGYALSAREVADLVERDKPFYDDSAGGATLTGGEPTAQADFLLELAGELAGRGIHTALETCGHFDGRLVERLVESVDLFLFDLKQVEERRHRQATGVGNRRILENFGAILARVGEERIVPRVPVIPGFSADPRSVAGTAAFLAEKAWRGPVHLLAHNTWARDKYRTLGRGAERVPAGSISEQQREEIARVYTQRGMKPIWS